MPTIRVAGDIFVWLKERRKAMDQDNVTPMYNTDTLDKEEIGDDKTFYQIYKVTNKVNGKIYIGLTKQGIEKRWDQHVYNANYKKPKKRTYFQRAIVKYGENNFYIKEIDTIIGLKNAKNLEMDYVAKFKSNVKDIGYNSTKGGDGGHNPETIQKLKDFFKTKEGFKERQKRSSFMKQRCQNKTRNYIPTEESVSKRRETIIKSTTKYVVNNPKVKLTSEQIDGIKQMDIQGIPSREIKEKYNISHNTIIKIRNDQYSTIRKDIPHPEYKKYTPDQLLEIIKDTCNEQEALKILNMTSDCFEYCISKMYLKQKVKDLFLNNIFKKYENIDFYTLSDECIRNAFKELRTVQNMSAAFKLSKKSIKKHLAKLSLITIDYSQKINLEELFSYYEYHSLQETYNYFPQPYTLIKEILFVHNKLRNEPLVYRNIDKTAEQIFADIKNCKSINEAKEVTELFSNWDRIISNLDIKEQCIQIIKNNSQRAKENGEIKLTLFEKFPKEMLLNLIQDCKTSKEAWEKLKISKQDYNSLLIKYQLKDFAQQIYLHNIQKAKQNNEDLSYLPISLVISKDEVLDKIKMCCTQNQALIALSINNITFNELLDKFQIRDECYKIFSENLRIRAWQTYNKDVLKHGNS